MKFENTEVWGFKHAIKGMRNPLESWNKSDSYFGYNQCDNCNHNHLCGKCFESDSNDCSVEAPIIGENDLRLMQNLIRVGSPDRKFMRQIFVSVDITAPLFWWKEFDTYKVGTIANSTSTMHKLSTTPITLDCFEIDDYDKDWFDNTGIEGACDTWVNDIIFLLETLRQEYLDTKDKRYWKELIRWLPESWLQTRTITMNYENIYQMIHQRKNHKLNEWSGKDNPDLPNFISWARTLPYAQELIFLDELDKDSK